MRSKKAYLLKIDGLVQGVGFRPFVYRLAVKNKLNGWVKNTNENVIIRIQGNQTNINAFLSSFKKEAPKTSFIKSIIIEELKFEDLLQIYIETSKKLKENPEIEKEIFELLSKFYEHLIFLVSIFPVHFQKL